MDLKVRLERHEYCLPRRLSNPPSRIRIVDSEQISLYSIAIPQTPFIVILSQDVLIQRFVDFNCRRIFCAVRF